MPPEHGRRLAGAPPAAHGWSRSTTATRSSRWTSRPGWHRSSGNSPAPRPRPNLASPSPPPTPAAASLPAASLAAASPGRAPRCPSGRPPAPAGKVAIREVRRHVPEVTESAQQADRVLTIPNAISVARLLGVPVFLWLVLGPRTPTADWLGGRLLIASAALRLAGRQDRPRAEPAEQARPAARPGRRPALHRGHPRRARRSAAIIPWWLVGAAGRPRARCSASRCSCCAGAAAGRCRSASSARPRR